MNDFWFTWTNPTDQFQTWSFLDGGNYFELPPKSSRTEENQYDLGDRIQIGISHKLRATLTLTGVGWLLDPLAQDYFTLSQDPLKKTVTLACIATFVTAS